MADQSLRTVSALLRLRAQDDPDRVVYTWLDEGEREQRALTLGDLDRQAQAIAAHLQARGAAGRCVVLMHPPGLEFVAAFFGCLYGGAVPVPVPAPRPDRPNDRLTGIVRDAAPTLLLTTAAVADALAGAARSSPASQSLPPVMATDRLDTTDAGVWREPALDAGSLAYLQYTSGSTSDPRGVIVTHANVLANLAFIEADGDFTSDSVSVSWLPHFHDMGLVFGLLQPVYSRFAVILFSPVAFIQRPVRWLRAIDAYRATHSGGPNFAYDLCVQRIGDAERHGLDLSCWRVAFNGAEPIHHDTLARFSRAFAACQFQPQAFYPVYGLAEATLMVTGARPGQGAVTRAGLRAGPDAVSVSSGRLRPPNDVRIVDPNTCREQPPGREGEIWVSGPSVAAGYWHRPAESTATFAARLAGDEEGPFLRTGDLGVVDDGELYVSGRLKDLIVIRGQNHHPHDIERTVQRCHAELGTCAGACFSVPSPEGERLVVAQEVSPRGTADPETLMAAIRQAVSEEHALVPHAIVLLRAGTLPKTSSGKIQRRACRDAFMADRLEALATQTVTGAETVREASSAPDARALIAACDAVAAADDARRRAAREYLTKRLADVLRRSPSAGTDPLTALGLDSMGAITLAHHLERDLGIVVPPTMLFAATPADLTTLIVDRVTRRAAPLVEEAPCETPAPLSYGQRALWLVHRVAPASAAYNIACALRSTSPLNVDRLRAAVDALVARHPMLRATFAMGPEGPLQDIFATADVWREVPAESWSDETLREYLGNEAHQPFDLETGPPARVELLTRQNGEHVLFLVIHHIVADFWSLAVVLRELAGHYAGTAAAGRPSRYIDYVRAQHDLLQGPRGDALWEYWRGQLGRELSALDLPTDHPRPAVQGDRGASYQFRIAAELTERLEAFAQARGTTLFVTLLSAYAILLHRYSGRDDLAIGTPSAGRKLARWADTVGYFVNPVVVRVDLPANARLDDVIAQVRGRVAGAMDHDELPFPLLVERLHPVRDAARAPLFQAMFLLHQERTFGVGRLGALALGVAGSRIAFGPQTLELVPIERRTAQFDLSWAMAHVDDGLAASVEYSTDLFEEATIRRMGEHFVTLLTAMVSQADRPIALLPMLSPTERRQLLYDWNGRRTVLPSTDICRQIEEQAARHPDAPAILFGTERWSYRQVNDRANHLARALVARGARPGVYVPVLMDRGPAVPLAMVAVMKTGAAFVPLAVDWPAARLRHVIGELHREALLVDDPARLARHGLDANPVVVDPWLDAGPAENLDTTVTPETPLYAMYTSGATGVPKGAIVPQRGIVNRFAWMNREFGAGAARTAVQTTPHIYDSAVWQFFWPLTNGGQTIVLSAEEASLTAASVTNLVATHRVTIIDFVPSVFDALVPELVEHDRTARQLESLQVVIVGGETMTPGTVRRFRRACPRIRVVNLYGPTEASIGCVCHTLDGTERDRIPIGRPIDNTAILVLDGHLQLTPVNVPGELYIAGTCVGLGYLHDLEKTRAAFLDNPYNELGYSILYKTGDRARRLPDGTLDYLGRLDGQVKIRGVRIELGEIEAHLKRLAGVRDAAATVHEDPRHEKRLVAYIVALPDAPPPDAHELRTALRAQLPEPMVPSIFVPTASLPRSAAGKLDRRALPAPDWTSLDRPDTFQAPGTATERLVADIWQRTLGVDRIGIDENFFDLGGHSLLATRIISQVQATLDVEVPLADIFARGSTIEGLSALIDRYRASALAHADPMSEDRRHERSSLAPR